MFDDDLDWRTALIIAGIALLTEAIKALNRKLKEGNNQ